MNLKYFIDGKTKEKIYTLKEKIDGKETKDAHYKFIKVRDERLRFGKLRYK